ncbi:hypothetical protein ISS05_03635 [Candidatus Woesearchaeota archaeon]|nr:hypothetical protein [Candidatus Woesearchaeota archaeon]
MKYRICLLFFVIVVLSSSGYAIVPDLDMDGQWDGGDFCPSSATGVKVDTFGCDCIEKLKSDCSTLISGSTLMTQYSTNTQTGIVDSICCDSTTEKCDITGSKAKCVNTNSATPQQAAPYIPSNEQCIYFYGPTSGILDKTIQEIFPEIINKVGGVGYSYSEEYVYLVEESGNVFVYDVNDLTDLKETTTIGAMFPTQSVGSTVDAFHIESNKYVAAGWNMYAVDTSNQAFSPQPVSNYLDNWNFNLGTTWIKIDAMALFNGHKFFAGNADQRVIYYNSNTALWGEVPYTDLPYNQIDALVGINDYLFAVTACPQGASTTPAATGGAVSSITVKNPNGGQQWTIGTTEKITWDYLNVDKVKIELECGSKKTVIVQETAASSKSYSWLIDAATSPSTDCKINISDTDTSKSLSDISDMTFAIVISSTPAPTCSIISPDSVDLGTGAGLTGQTTDATSFSIAGVGDFIIPLGYGGQTDTRFVNPTTTTTYTGTVIGPGGQNTCTKTIQVIDQAGNVISPVPKLTSTVTLTGPSAVNKGSTFTLNWNAITNAVDYQLHWKKNSDTTWTKVPSNYGVTFPSATEAVVNTIDQWGIDTYNYKIIACSVSATGDCPAASILSESNVVDVTISKLKNQIIVDSEKIETISLGDTYYFYNLDGYAVASFTDAGGLHIDGTDKTITNCANAGIDATDAAFIIYGSTPTKINGYISKSGDLCRDSNTIVTSCTNPPSGSFILEKNGVNVAYIGSDGSLCLDQYDKLIHQNMVISGFAPGCDLQVDNPCTIPYQMDAGCFEASVVSCPAVWDTSDVSLDYPYCTSKDPAKPNYLICTIQGFTGKYNCDKTCIK